MAEIYHCLALLAGYAGGFTCTYLFGIPKEAITEGSNNKEVPEAKAKTKVAATGEQKEMNDTTLGSAFKLPFDGYIVPLEDVPDAVFFFKDAGRRFCHRTN